MDCDSEYVSEGGSEYPLVEHGFTGLYQADEIRNWEIASLGDGKRGFTRIPEIEQVGKKEGAWAENRILVAVATPLFWQRKAIRNRSPGEEGDILVKFLDIPFKLSAGHNFFNIRIPLFLAAKVKQIYNLRYNEIYKFIYPR